MLDAHLACFHRLEDRDVGGYVSHDREADFGGSLQDREVRFSRQERVDLDEVDAGPTESVNRPTGLSRGPQRDGDTGIDRFRTVQDRSCRNDARPFQALRSGSPPDLFQHHEGAAHISDPRDPGPCERRQKRLGHRGVPQRVDVHVPQSGNRIKTGSVDVGWV